MSLGAVIVIAAGILLQLFIGIVVGLALVRLNVDEDGFWPEKRLKKAALFLAGFCFWPVVLLRLAVGVLDALSGGS